MGKSNSSSKRSWTINHGTPPTPPPYSASQWEKFRLLLWKNYKIHVRHKFETLVEILLPLLFTAVLVIVRNVVPSTFVEKPTIYRPLILEGAPPAILMKCNEVYYTPKDPTLENFMRKVNDQYFVSQGLEYNFTGFDSEEELVQSYLIAAGEEIVHSLDDMDTTVPILAGIVFNSELENGTFPKNINYTLRPAGQRGQFDIISEKFGVKPSWFTELIYPLFQMLGPRSRSSIGGGLPGYHEEGFLYLQYAIDRTLSREILNSTELVQEYNKYDIKLQRFPYPPFIDDKYLFALQGWLPLIIMLSFIYPGIHTTKQIIYEKEKRLKEYMKIQGLPNGLHWTAWFIKSYTFLIITIILMSILLKSKVLPSQSLAVLPESDITVIFFVFLVFGFSLICFAFLISAIFAHANAGATAAGVLWFVSYVPFGFLQPRYNLLSHRVKLMSCFLTNMPICFSMQLFCMFEGTGAGLQWNALFQGSGPDDDFSMGDCLIMMVVNGCVYISTALYLEAVRPGEFGMPLPWYFIFTKWFWTGKPRRISHYEKREDMKDEDSSVPTDLMETEPQNLTPGIKIKGLTKVYDNDKLAVKNLTLNFYEGQITAFLGHNGAGKTTTISMLSGLYQPTSGTASINDYDICTDINSARSSLGLCPQYDILFDELTVEEHLRFYCLLKGCNPDSVGYEINRMIKALGLESKRHAQSQTLSGGMKRKLSVGIAFCGGSKCVLLDEPTSGMDPGARRAVWDLVQNEKRKRTIVLSTHCMEEADVIADRICIMAAGEIQCCGSSLFLKKKYGGGYHLIIVKDPNCDVPEVTKFLQKTISEVEVDEDVGAELSYSLPEDKSHLFADMFEELERRKEELKIASYGMSNTTIEEVFIRVGKQLEARILAQHATIEEARPKQAVNLIMENNEVVGNSQTHLYQDEPPRNTGLFLKIQQFRGMVKKKLIYASRNRILLLTQMGIPILYLVLILIILKNLPGFLDSPPHELSLRKYEKLGKTVTTIRCLENNTICQSYKDFVSRDFLTEIVDKNESFVDFMLEKEMKDLVTVNFRYIVGFDQRKKKENDTELRQLVGFFNNQPFHAPPLSLNFITNAVLYPTNHTVTITNHPLPLSSIDTLKHVGSLYTKGFQIGYNIAFGMSFLAASFVVFLITERESRSKHIQLVSGAEYPLFWTANFVIDFIQFMIPALLIGVILLAFQIEEFQPLDMQGYLLILFICYGLAVIPMMYLFSFTFSIPTSGFTKLVLFNLFTGMASMLTVVIIQVPEFHLEAVADYLNTIFLIFPNYALGMGIVQLSTNYQIAKDCAKFNLEFVCSAFPTTVCCAKLKSNFLDWERVGIGKNIVFLLVAFCIYFVLLIVVESGVIRMLKRCLVKRKPKKQSHIEGEESTIEDSNVVEEEKRIQKTDLDTLCRENTVVLRNLTKRYGNFTAVENLNIGIKRGECFGLLGINGAGKTTTFKMLTGDLPMSEGEAYVCSKSVRNELKQVHEVLGYCPQFDALIDEMTGRETVELYARLRGIQESYIPRLIDALGEILLFSQYMDRRVGTYSGGNKRKLSTAIALVGSPPVIFLDEMTTGMDPVARRSMWDAISKIRDAGTSIVLTSHSMDECEALCLRLVIMVNGKFRCLGSPQQLKSKCGEGYTLIAQTSPKEAPNPGEPFTRSKQELGRKRSSISSFRRAKSPQGWESELEELRTYIEENFPGSTLKDIHPGFVHYQVPNGCLKSLFNTMEIAKSKFNLKAYSVGQCTLEQVFLTFTKAQINVE